jgi:hypothetical protein
MPRENPLRQALRNGRSCQPFTHGKVDPSLAGYNFPFIACPPLLQAGSLGPSHHQLEEVCSHFHGQLHLTVLLPHSFFIFSSLSATIGGEEDSLIHLARLLYQSLAISVMFQSNLLGLRIKQCLKNMVEQHSRAPNLLILSPRVIR